jgi:hypothetical protein
MVPKGIWISSTSRLLLAKSKKAVELMTPMPSPHGQRQLTRVNSTNVLDEGLRIGEIGHRMNSKVKSVKQGVYQKQTWV